MIDQIRELERRLKEVEKALPFVPAGEFEKARADLDSVRDMITVLKLSAGSHGLH